MMNKKTRGIIALVLSAILLLGVFPHSKEIGFSMEAEAALQTAPVPDRMISYSENSDYFVVTLNNEQDSGLMYNIDIYARVELRDGSTQDEYYGQLIASTLFPWDINIPFDDFEIYAPCNVTFYIEDAYDDYRVIETGYTYGITRTANGGVKATRGGIDLSQAGHSYIWSVVQPATIEQIGIKEYRCTCGCGDVQKTEYFSGDAYYSKSFTACVEDAKENGDVYYSAGGYHYFSDFMLEKMAERNDITYTIEFEYGGDIARFVIPEGTDYSFLFEDDTMFYGHLYFCQLLSLTVEFVE